jgi:hypothetical protein
VSDNDTVQPSDPGQSGPPQDTPPPPPPPELPPPDANLMGTEYRSRTDMDLLRRDVEKR